MSFKPVGTTTGTPHCCWTNEWNPLIILSENETSHSRKTTLLISPVTVILQPNHRKWTSLLSSLSSCLSTLPFSFHPEYQWLEKLRCRNMAFSSLADNRLSLRFTLGGLGTLLTWTQWASGCPKWTNHMRKQRRENGKKHPLLLPPLTFPGASALSDFEA